MENNIDELVFSAVFSNDEKVKESSKKLIKKIAEKKGIKLSSIHNLYMNFGKGKVSGFTVPAINIRTLTYDTARVIFQIIKEKNIGPVIFEIAKSEIKYTKQLPSEFSFCIIAAALKEKYSGPIYIQGDHYQFSAKKFTENPKKEIEKIKHLIKESVESGFYNIDIDASTLVDLNKPTLNEQQKNNYQMTALMTEYIRSIQPKNIIISIGGEIGHIGGKNSTIEEFKAFMENYLKIIKRKKIVGISKVSVQTGTSHGGIPLPDGKIAKVNLDFNILKTISEFARNKYHIGGSVQHGASTLPNQLFDRFVKNKTLEIHLATGFQNLVYDNLPKGIKRKIYQWLKVNCADEKKEGQTIDQFLYKTRKKALGPFKKELWSMTDIEKKPILFSLKKQFEFLFKKLNILNTRGYDGS